MSYRQENLNSLIRERHSEEYYDKILSITFNDVSSLKEASLKVLSNIPRKSGMCIIMSAFLCADLRFFVNFGEKYLIKQF